MLFRSCCFCAEIKVLGMTWKFMRIFCGIYKKYWRKNYLEGWSQEPTSPGGTSPPGRAWQACEALVAPPPPTPALFSLFRPEKIREKSSSRFSTHSCRHHLFFLWRADLESVLCSGEGKSSPSLSPTFLHRQFQDALHRS